MDKLKIFVSSVMENMQEERTAVVKAIASHKYFEALTAETFVARSESPREVCIEKVEESDIYIGVFKDRYGWIPKRNNSEKLSVTAIEYETARRNGIPLLIFIAQDDSRRETNLRNFLEKISDFESGHWRKQFKDPQELALQVEEALETEVVSSYKSIKGKPKFDYCAYLTDLLKNESQRFGNIEEMYIDIFAHYGQGEFGTMSSEFVRGLPNELNIYAANSEYGLNMNSRQCEKETILTVIRNSRRLLIVGDPGAGKTTALRRVLLDYAREYISGNLSVPIPVYVELSYYKKSIDLVDLVRGGIPRSTFLNDLEEGRYLLLFDGLNEIDTSFSEKAMSQLEVFQKNYSANRFVFTTRKGMDHGWNNRTVFLEPLGYKQIVNYLAKCFNGNIERAELFWKKILYENINELAATPMFLSMLVLIYMIKGELPRNKAELYQHFERFAGRFNRKFVGEHILPAIAYEMLNRGVIALLRSELENIIAGELNDLLGRRIVQQDSNVYSVLGEITNSRIMVGNKTYRFCHQSFRDYFAAKELVEKKDIDEVSALVNTANWELHSLLLYPTKNTNETEFYESIIMYLDMIDHRKNIEFIEKILDKDLVFACRCFGSMAEDNGNHVIETKLLEMLANKLEFKKARRKEDEERIRRENWQNRHLAVIGFGYMKSERTYEYLVQRALMNYTHDKPDIEWTAIDALFHLYPERTKAFLKEREWILFERIHKHSWAGYIYPENPILLRKTIRHSLRSGERKSALGAIVPTTGYAYSNRIIGAVFSKIELPEDIVIISASYLWPMGPPCSIMTDGVWETPLGSIRIDSDLAEYMERKSSYLVKDSVAHSKEHAIEMILPYIQYLKPDTRIVPIAMKYVPYGMCEEIGHVLSSAISEMRKSTLVIAAGTLGNFEPQESTIKKDHRAIEKIQKLDPRSFYYNLGDNPIRCAIPITIVIVSALDRGATNVDLIKYGTTGDVTGNYESVTGQAGIVIS